MKKALLFPEYVPSALEFRINLLLNDRVSTIVPGVDQAIVLRHPQVSELREVLPDGVFTFCDPSLVYSEKFDGREMTAQIKKIGSPISRSKAHIEGWGRARLNERGELQDGSMETKRGVVSRLKDSGWVPLASQKIHPHVMEWLFEKRLAVRVPGVHLQQSPILVHPRIAGFILAQLARTLAEIEEALLIASSANVLKDALFEGDEKARPSDQEMMAVMLEIAMPEAINRISPNQFEYVRSEFDSVRQNLKVVVEGLRSNFFLDSAKNVTEFREFVKDNTNDMRLAIAKAEKAIESDRNAKKVNWGLNVLSSAVGAGIGAAMGNIHGAAFGAIVAPVVTGAGQFLSTSTIGCHNEQVIRLAALQASINQGRRRPKFIRFG